MFLDDDDLLFSDHIEVLAEALFNNADAEARMPPVGRCTRKSITSAEPMLSGFANCLRPWQAHSPTTTCFTTTSRPFKR